MQFRYLHRFLLCSSVAVSDDDDDQEEFDLVNIWAGSASVTAGPVHPSLCYVTLWTFSHSPHGKLSYWQRLQNRRWAMVGRAVPPNWGAFI